MANGGMKGSPIPRTQQEGKAVAFKPACDYVKQPGGAYGSKSGLTPRRARTHNYTPPIADQVGKG